jgi:hemolysin III
MNQKTRIQTKYEEFINSLTHGLGGILAIPAVLYLIYFSIQNGDYYRTISFIVYGISLLLILFLSAMYHGVKKLPLKEFLNKLDHAGIFIFIAGTYTPFLLVTLRDGIGIPMLILIWAIAFLGVFSEILWFKIFKNYTVWICLIMGWMAISQLKPLITNLQFSAIILLILGGLTFTIGVIFYKLDHIK